MPLTSRFSDNVSRGGGSDDDFDVGGGAVGGDPDAFALS